MGCRNGKITPYSSGNITDIQHDEDSFNCSICFNVFTEPKALICLHTFCKNCLQQYIDQQSNAVARQGFCCPICRQFHPISNTADVTRWADSVTTDFRIQAMIDASTNRDRIERNDTITNLLEPIRALNDVSVQERRFAIVNTISTEMSDEYGSQVHDIKVLKQEVGDVIVVSCDDCVKSFWFDRRKDREFSSRVSPSIHSYQKFKICKITDHSIAVVNDDREIHIINVKPSLSKSTTIKTENEYYSICAMTTPTHSGNETRFVLGHDSGISIVDMKGVIVKDMDRDIAGRNYTEQPEYLTLTPTGNILVSDKNTCLLCIAQNKQVLWSCPIDHPAGVDCDAQGNIYVADCDNDRVVALSPDGNFIKNVLSCDHIENPVGLYFDSEKLRLYIAEESGLIKIYQHT